MIKIIKPVFVFTLLSLALIAQAQNNTHSPYSARGIGESEPFNTAYSKALGGATNGIRSTRFISLSNPASLSALKQVVFDFGFTGASGKLTTQQTASTYYNGNFNYVVLGFPIWQREMLAKDTSKSRNKTSTKTTLIKTYRTIWSSAIGLTPYSNLGTSSYKVTDTTYGQLTSSYTKSGGLSNFFIMNSVNLTKNISLGATVSYVFGQIKSGTELIVNDSGVSRALEDVSSYYLHGFKYNFGLQTQHYDTFSKRVIKKVLNKKDSTYKKDTSYKKVPLKIIFGATLNNQSPLRYNYTRLALNKSNYYLLNPADTVIKKSDKGKTYTPSSFSAGFSLRYNNLWLFSFDYTTNFYGTMKSPLFGDKYTNSAQYTIGLGYKPDQDVENMHIKRGKKNKSNLEYRLGFRYFNTGYNFKDNTGNISPLIETGLTAGIGVPLLKRNPYTRETVKSMINFTMEYINRGTTKNGMVQEQLLKLTIGVTLGDIWFTKRKFN